VHREGHLRVVQDLAHARDGHGDGRGGRREGAKGRAPRRGSSSGDVSEALRRVSPGDARRSERPGSRWAAVSRKNSSWHEDMSVGNQSEENRRLSGCNSAVFANVGRPDFREYRDVLGSIFPAHLR
jgi:hypothetical protein